MNSLTRKIRTILPLVLLLCGTFAGMACGDVKIPWYMIPPAAPSLIIPEDYSLLPPEVVQNVLQQGSLTVSFLNVLPEKALQARTILWGVVFDESSQKGHLSRAQMKWLSRAGSTQPGIRSLLFKKPPVLGSQDVVSKKDAKPIPLPKEPEG